MPGEPGAPGAPGEQGAQGEPGVSFGSLTGLVTEAADGNLVEAATVAVEPAAVAPTTTNADGEFTLPALPVGVYTVRATFESYPPVEGTVSIVAGGEAALNLEFLNWRPESDACILCHGNLDPQAVADYKASSMAQEVSCQDCHGPNMAGGPGHNPIPTPETCARCHPDQYRGHQSNRHSIGYQRTFEAGRLDDLPACAVGAEADGRGVATCTQCHNVESRCDACHSRHIFKGSQARKPGACGTCHMGPDHPQYEIYELSKHGIMFASEGDTGLAPSCPDCHMPHKVVAPDGTRYTDHDLSFGIAYGPVGGRDSHASLRRGGQLPYVLNNGALAPNPDFDPTAPADMTGGDGVPDSAIWPEDRDGKLVQVVDEAPVLAARRQEMERVCDRCHAAGFAAERLDIADGMHRQAASVVHEAEDIIRALNFDGLLDPAVGARPANPDAVGAIILGGTQLYRNLSGIERTFFKMYKYDQVKTWHGAYHMNPDYTHWYGWAELNLDLSDIADQATDRRRDFVLEYAIEHGLEVVWDVPYQGVIYAVGSMEKLYDLFPAGVGPSIDANGSGSPTTYTGLTFH